MPSSSLRPLAAVVLATASLASAGPRPACEFFRGAGARPAIPVEAELPEVLAAQTDVDILDYDVAVFVDFTNRAIQGTATIRFVAAPGVPSADQLVLDFGNSLVVDAVAQDGVTLPPAARQRAGNVLTITLTPPAVGGGPVEEVAVTYHSAGGFFGVFFDVHGAPAQPIVNTYGELMGARWWFPCKDRPDDKALFRISVEAPVGFSVVAGGLRESVVPGRAGCSITTWSSRYPVATYLVAFAATDYVSWGDSYTSQDGSVTMPLTHWAYPELEAAARQDFSRTPAMLDAFARLWGEYPFIDETYGHKIVPSGLSWEHQTNCSYNDVGIDGNNTGDGIVAHELSHQWWGDSVTPTTFASTFLSEGFATYAEATWVELRDGLPAYLQFMQSIQLPGGLDDTTVDAPNPPLSFVVYLKGAWVVHMLRWVLGGPVGATDRETIDVVLRAHAAEHPLGNAQTSDFVATAERVSGQDLSWFFDEWLHRMGHPHYDVGWCSTPRRGGGFTVHLRVTQTQPDVYRMPVLVRLTMPASVQDVLVQSDAAQQDWEWFTDEAPLGVAWDPDGWILKDVQVVPLDACTPGIDFDADGRLNEVDCAPLDPGAFDLPADATLLRVSRGPGPASTIDVTPPDDGVQRPYVVDLQRGMLNDLLAQRDTLAGTCLRAAIPAGPYVDADALSPGGDWYLAYPWNGCGDLAPDGTWASPCR